MIEKQANHSQENKDLIVRNGEGYYQALHRFMPELSPKELCALSKQMQKENGNVLKAGERLHIPALDIVASHPNRSDSHSNNGPKKPETQDDIKTGTKPGSKPNKHSDKDEHNSAQATNAYESRNEAFVKALGATASDAADKFDHSVSKPIRDTATGAYKEATQAVDRTGKAINQTVNETGRNINHELNKTGKSINHELTEAGRAINHNLAQTEKALNKSWNDVSRGVNQSLDETGKYAKRVGEDANHTVQVAGKAISDTANKVANQLKPNEQTQAAWKQFEESQDRLTQQREQENRQRLINSTASISKLLQSSKQAAEAGKDLMDKTAEFVINQLKF